jgi:hypothetical protein
VRLSDLAVGAKVVAVGQGEPARARRFALLHGLPCPLLCDPARRAYEAYGLLEGRPSQVVYGMPDEFLRCDADFAEPQVLVAVIEEARLGLKYG